MVYDTVYTFSNEPVIQYELKHLLKIIFFLHRVLSQFPAVNHRVKGLPKSEWPFALK